MVAAAVTTAAVWVCVKKKKKKTGKALAKHAVNKGRHAGGPFEHGAYDEWYTAQMGQAQCFDSCTKGGDGCFLIRRTGNELFFVINLAKEPLEFPVVVIDDKYLMFGTVYDSITGIVDQLRGQSNGVMQLTKPGRGGVVFEEPAGTGWLAESNVHNALNDGLNEQRASIVAQMQARGDEEMEGWGPNAPTGKERVYMVQKRGGSFGFGVEQAGEETDNLVISAVTPGSHAAELGLPLMARLVSVDGASIKGMSCAKVLGVLRSREAAVQIVVVPKASRGSMKKKKRYKCMRCNGRLRVGKWHHEAGGEANVCGKCFKSMTEEIKKGFFPVKDTQVSAW